MLGHYLILGSAGLFKVTVENPPLNGVLFYPRWVGRG